jgi:hypothetical protein
MSFSFYNSIPAAADYPGDDQPLMLINNQSTASLIAVDHVGFNTPGGGKHEQVTFNSENTPSAPTDPVSVLYTKAGTASTKADLRFINANASFPISLVRATGLWQSSAFVAAQSFNMVSITLGGSNIYTFTISPNVVTGTSYGVIMTSSFLPGNLTITSATTFTCQFFGAGSNTPAQPGFINCLVWQI